MKKYLIFTITLFLFIRVQAVTEKYSEWSSEYPTEISKLLIRKEDRYLWYKDVITDEKYIMKELVKDKIIDYNDIVQKKSDGENWYYITFNIYFRCFWFHRIWYI